MSPKMDTTMAAFTCINEQCHRVSPASFKLKNIAPTKTKTQCTAHKNIKESNNSIHCRINIKKIQFKPKSVNSLNSLLNNKNASIMVTLREEEGRACLVT